VSGLRITLRVAGVLAALVILILTFAYWYDSVGQRSDPTFDATVAHPAYAAGRGPRVAFDVAHHNWHTPTGRYKPLADLLRSDGDRVREVSSAFTPAALDSVDVLIIANALGPDGHEGQAAFTVGEDAVVSAWVERGGALLLIADHSPFGSAAKDLAARFGVTMYLAFARDDAKHAGWDNERLVFSRGNGLLADHPITDGHSPLEWVDKVVTFTGQSLSVPAGAEPILRMDADSYDWQSRSIRHSARGHAQCVALTPGKGRAVILGEAAVLSAQVDPLGNKIGMNRADNDDRQFALNLVRWLAGYRPRQTANPIASPTTAR
jgi:hypothetical protein